MIATCCGGMWHVSLISVVSLSEWRTYHSTETRTNLFQLRGFLACFAEDSTSSSLADGTEKWLETLVFISQSEVIDEGWMLELLEHVSKERYGTSCSFMSLIVHCTLVLFPFRSLCAAIVYCFSSLLPHELLHETSFWYQIACYSRQSGESRTQQEAFSGDLIAASTGLSGSWCVNFVQCCLTLWTWVEWFCPQFCPHLLAGVENTPDSIPNSNTKSV